MKNSKWLMIAAVLFVLLLLSFILISGRIRLTEVSDSNQTASDSAAESEDSASYLHIRYQGKEYSYNSQIITVLYAGVDSDQDLAACNRYSIAPRADTIELLIFDDYNRKISILAINRDTITSVARYTMNGNYRDHYNTHLGYAFTYGDGGQVSCNNLMESVRTLMKDVPIQEYVITNNRAVTEVNDLAGGITVTVPNNDLVEKSPEFKKGAVVTLNAETAELFVRWRDSTKLYTNNGRMERQREFSTEAIKKLIQLVENDAEGTWNSIEKLAAEYQTSITKDQYLDLAERIETEKFSEDQYYVLKGENVHDDERDLDMFYLDEDDLMDTIIRLFYLEDE